MPISNRIAILAPVLAGLLSAFAAADNIVLTDGSRLTGTVRGIDEAGVVELASDLSPDPISLKADAVEKVEFSETAPDPESPGALVELVNGDLLPVRVERMDDANLRVVSPDAGPLVIPRAALKSMQLGVRKRRVIYSGPHGIGEWTRDLEGSKGWRVAADLRLSANGNAVAARHFDLPRQFTLKFSLKWSAHPNLQVYFADPLTNKPEAVDRYILSFAGSGFTLQRESSKGDRLRPIFLPVRSADQFFMRTVDVELRVDRKTSRIHLFLNGEPESAGVDPGADPPTGGGIVFASMVPAGMTQEIHDIQVLDFDNSSVRHRSEERGDPKIDSMISRDDDRWGGRLTSIHGGPDGPVFSFKSDFQEQPLELSESDVSTVFFAKPEAPPAVNPAGPFVLKLRGEGSLRLSSCHFGEAGITATHPLLGELKIARTGVAAFERSKPPSPKAAEK